MQHFYITDSVTGAAKTYSATNYATDKARRGLNFCFIMPTSILIDKTVKELLERRPDALERIHIVKGDPIEPRKVTARITEFLLSVKAGDGQILFITHEAFLRQPHWHQRANWHLVVDEVIEATYSETFSLYENRDILIEKISLEYHNEKYSRLFAQDHGAVVDWARNLKKDNVTALFTALAGKLKSTSGWSCYVSTEQFHAFAEGAVQLEVHGVLSPVIFADFASVTLMGANLRLSMMYLAFLKSGCTFSPHKAIMAGLRYTEHTNGSRLKVYYFTDRLWSKKLRDSRVGDIGMMDLFKAEIVRKFIGSPYLWIGNKDVATNAFAGTRLDNKPQGLNDYQHFNKCAVVSALNASVAHSKFLSELLGISDEQRRRAMLSQVAYQALGRGSMRNPDAICDFELIVPDRFTADDILKMYPDSTLLRLLPYDPAPYEKCNGRPKIHNSSAERLKAWRKMKREK
jgi:hypothetical protein